MSSNVAVDDVLATFQDHRSGRTQGSAEVVHELVNIHERGFRDAFEPGTGESSIP